MYLPFSQIGYHVLHLNVPGASVGISVPASLIILYHPGSSRSSLIAISEFVRLRLYPGDLLTSSNRLWLMYYMKQQLKRWYDKQLNWCTLQWSLKVKKIFSSLESVQTLQLLNTHLVNFKFVLRNYCFTVFAIYFVDRKYEVNSWIEIGINFDIFQIRIFNVEFSYFII